MKVTKTSENEGNLVDVRVRFQIDYVGSDKRIKHDTWKYGRVAEG